MKSKAHRRSGSAFHEYLYECGITPSSLYIVGVGVDPGEALAFQKLWPDAPIFGWEPNPYTFEGLSPLFPGVLVDHALSNQSGVEKLYFRHGWKNGSSLFKPEEENGRGAECFVQVDTLDGSVICSDAEENTVLWLDCEGSELKVLQGGVKFLSKVCAINVEMTGRPRGEGWAKPWDIHNFLMVHGFRQVYIHSIRTVRGQYDAIYLRKDLVVPEMCACLDTLR